MKKIILLLSTVLLLAALTAQAQFTYTTNNSAITITGYTGSDPFVTIPTNINGLTVTSIGSNAFEQMLLLSSVTIPNTVTNIGDYAFFGCQSLSMVTIGSSVTSIGNYAFFGCESLQTYPLFSYPPGITIPTNVTYIGDAAFGDTGPNIITIPASVTNIGINPFANCTSLYAISVDTNNPEYISVGGALLNRSQTTLIGYVQRNAVSSYAVSNTVTSIGSDAFAGCSELANISIPSSVTSIGYSAFLGCSGLTDAPIPYSVTNIGAAPFQGCSNLTAISVATNNPAYVSVSNVLFNQSQTLLIEYPDAQATGPYAIPDSVTNIGSMAFASCGNLTGITIPGSVINIGAKAFSNCVSLSSISIPNSVTSIGDYAFADTSLIIVVIPNSVTNIGAGAFTACYGLTGIVLPNSITSISEYTFYISSLTNVIIPASVTNIADYAFGDCGLLRGVYFQSNAPAVDSTSFLSDYTRTIVYYLLGTTGWGPTFAGVRTALWTPTILTSDGFFSAQSNQFGFNISWASNLTVVVQAATSLASPVWQPLSTNTLTNGVIYFSDPNWTNYPARFYRVSYP